MCCFLSIPVHPRSRATLSPINELLYEASAAGFGLKPASPPRPPQPPQDPSISISKLQDSVRAGGRGLGVEAEPGGAGLPARLGVAQGGPPRPPSRGAPGAVPKPLGAWHGDGGQASACTGSEPPSPPAPGGEPVIHTGWEGGERPAELCQTQCTRRRSLCGWCQGGRRGGGMGLSCTPKGSGVTPKQRGGSQ